VTAGLFGAGVTTHVLLVAGLRNPTARRRYLAAQELLIDDGHREFYETLLELLRCARIGRERVERHLDALNEAFDAAMAVATAPFCFALDIADTACPTAIDGSRELIAAGRYREAVFWLVQPSHGVRRCWPWTRRRGCETGSPSANGGRSATRGSPRPPTFRDGAPKSRRRRLVSFRWRRDHCRAP